MKSNSSFRGKPAREPEETFKKAVKLTPIKKSGKERHQIFGAIEEEDEDIDYPFKRESVLDYFDDEDELTGDL